MIDPQSPLHGGGPDADRLERRRRRDRFLDAGCGDCERCRCWRSAGSASSSARPAGGATRPNCARRSRTPATGIVVAPNFSTGVVLFEAIVAHAATLFAPQADFGAFLHEAHHCGEEGCAVGHGAAAEEDDGAGRVPAADRRVVDARRLHSGHAYGRVRRSGGDDHADAHRPRSHGVRPRRAGGGAVGPRQARLVHNAGCAGIT